MSQEFDDLTQAVNDENTVIDSATVLLKTLADKVEAAAGDKAASIALAASIRSKTADFSAAIAAVPAVS